MLNVAEITLALLLFSDASHLRLRDVSGDRGPALRLLLIGLPLTLVAGTVLAYVVFPEELGTVALVDQVVDIAAVTVVLSIVVHGLSAAPLAARYGRWATGLPDDAPEKVSVAPPSTRRIALHAPASIIDVPGGHDPGTKGDENPPPSGA
ncbi:hypothetical protein [Nocardia rosealba]|uniref:hypothetical protein n=1 Tax=Nocardia rosealba TaxID=2878563 RepID=UPI001CD9E8CC|nr:hypothetical protein [Nocardia rosealba]MCA2207296.1 hypothetical protein [Nocardia rosealba]